MLYLLNLKANGYKLLKEHFSIDFTSKARVYQAEKEKEMIEIDKGLYVFRTLAFVGGNSSGKSTVLSLILKTLVFLQTGRWEFVARDFKKDMIEIECLFYLDGFIYNYKFAVGKLDLSKISIGNKYCPIYNEKLLGLKYDKSRGIKNLDIINESANDFSDIFKMSLNDTSAIIKLTSNQIIVDEFNNNNITNFNEAIVRSTFFESLNSCSKKLVSSIIRLLDDSIEYIICDNTDHVKLKRFNEDELILSKVELISLLSAGTFRGVELFIRCINALKYGKVFIVDEIENCFQKNVVFYLLFLFNDSKINSKGAQLFFSTHYIEVLDYLNRRDGIFITHKELGSISIKNLYSDYNVRSELSKSKQFDNNVFNTSLNYKQVLEVRRNLVDELYSNND